MLLGIAALVAGGLVAARFALKKRRQDKNSGGSRYGRAQRGTQGGSRKGNGGWR